MTEAPPTSYAYLLRLWQASSAGTRVWRALLANVQTGERRSFADLQSLFVFLEAQTRADVRSDDRSPPIEL